VSDPLLDLARELRGEFADALRTARAAGSAVTVAKIAQRSLKGTADTLPDRASWACRSGCSFCCHNAVSVSAPEAFRLADALRRLPAEERASLERNVRARAAELVGIPLREQANRRTPCALLAPDGACRRYAERPLPCIGLASFDRGACERVFRGLGKADLIPIDNVLLSVSGAHNLALRLACRDVGLSSVRYELHDALVVALNDPDAERRWLAGEDPFARCRPDLTSVGPEAEAELARFADLLS
jgi:hypothetical protein